MATTDRLIPHKGEKFGGQHQDANGKFHVSEALCALLAKPNPQPGVIGRKMR